MGDCRIKKDVCRDPFRKSRFSKFGGSLFGGSFCIVRLRTHIGNTPGDPFLWKRQKSFADIQNY